MAVEIAGQFAVHVPSTFTEEVAPSSAADWAQYYAALASNDLAREAINIAWASTIVNALVVATAVLVPLVQQAYLWLRDKRDREQRVLTLKRCCFDATNGVLGLSERLIDQFFAGVPEREGYSGLDYTIQQMERLRRTLRVAMERETETHLFGLALQISVLVDNLLDAVVLVKPHELARRAGSQAKVHEQAIAEFKRALHPLKDRAERQMLTVEGWGFL